MSRDVTIRLAIQDDEKVKAALRSAGAAGAEALALLERGASRTAQSLRALEQSVDPVARSSARMAAAQDTINRALEKGHITQQRAAELNALAARQYADTADGATRMAASTDRAAHAVRGLGIQSIDVFQQLASGAPVMTTFIQQGSQVAQQSAAMGVSLGAVARGAASAVAAYLPLIAAFGTVAAAAGAAYVVFGRASELAAQQRALSVAIQGVGRSADLSSGQLQGYVRQLERQGVASADAMKAVADLSRNAGLSGGAINRIVGLAPDAAAALGTSVPEMMDRLARAAKGSVDAVQDLTDAFNLLTPAEEASIRRQIEHGERASALDAVFEKLGQRVQGLSREALSPAEQATRDLGNAWAAFVDRVAGSELVIGVIERLASALRSIAGLIEPNGSPGQSITTLDAQIAAMSGDIPGTNATAARLRRDQAEALSRLWSQRNALAQSLADQVESGGGIPPAVTIPIPGAGGGMASPAATVAREIDRRAAERVAGSSAGQVARLTQELKEYREQLAAIPRESDEWAARAPNLQSAIQATTQAIEEAARKGEEHLDSLERTRATYASQTRAQTELAVAYGQGRDAVARVIAVREAEAKVLEANLIPGTERHATAVADLTARIRDLRQAEAGAKIAERVAETNEATEAQLRIAEAYDGTEASLIRAQNAEKALAEVRRSGLSPDGTDFADAVARVAEAYDRSSAAASAFQHQQQSVQATLSTIETTADRIGQSLVDGFLNGRDAAVTMASVARAAFASLGTDVVRLGVITPLVNGVLGTSRPSLWTGLESVSSGGGGSLFGALNNALSLGRASDALGLTDFGGGITTATDWLGLTGSNGIFSNVGGITGLLNTPLWGATAGIEAATAANIGSAIGPGGLLSEAAVAGNLGISSSIGSTGVTLGQALSGVGAGFGAGSLLGGVLQRSLNRVGPAPTIGAGLGAGVGTLIGGPIGGLIGGLLGGAGGSLIGPRPATPFSATGLTVGADGMLAVGRTVSQIVDTTAEVAALNEQVARVNAVLQASGARITNAVSTDEFGQNRLVGGTSGEWLNFGQGGGRPGSLSDAFGELRFTAANDNAASAVANRAFGSLDELAQVLDRVARATSFLDDLVPTLTDLTERSTQFSDALKGVNDRYAEAITFAHDTAQMQGLSAEMAARLQQAESDLIGAREAATLQAVDAVMDLVAAPAGAIPAQMKEINRTYDAAIGDIQRAVGASAAVTERLAQAEQALIAARDERLQGVYDEAAKTTTAYNAQLNIRLLGATADPAVARLAAFDEQARLEREALNKTLVDMWGEQITSAQAYADQMLLLDRTLAAERKAIQEEADRIALAQAERAAAEQVQARLVGFSRERDGLRLIQSQQNTLTGFLDRMIATGSSPVEQLRIAQERFGSALDSARAGGLRAADLSSVVAAADSLVGAGRSFYATGPGSADLERFVQRSIESLGSQLGLPQFGGDLDSTLASVMEPLGDEMALLRREVSALRDELRSQRLRAIA